jgi:hypothetical protein
MVVVITKCIILFCFCVSTVMLDRQTVVNGCSGTLQPLNTICRSNMTVETQKLENYTLCDHYNHWPLSVDLTWLLKHKNKSELYTLWSLQSLTTICLSNMIVETQKQKRIIHSRVMLDRQIVVNGCSDHKVYNSLVFVFQESC